jgi:hypothetical protein
MGELALPAFMRRKKVLTSKLVFATGKIGAVIHRCYARGWLAGASDKKSPFQVRFGASAAA